MSKRQILVTAALPYANSKIHIGHLVEYCQADFWARFQKMRGHICNYVCADDTHGTPIMVSARKRGITPEVLIAEVWKEHTRDFIDCQIEHDHYSSTNSLANKELCTEFFLKMQAKGHIVSRDVKQLYCEVDKMFLPDRFVKGTCPKCASQDQYGDSCDVCAATYSPADLKNPYCSVCGTTPVTKSSEHLMFKLNDFREFLLNFLSEHTTKETANKMKEWFNEPLRDWDISRDAPYFGFEIPGHPNKYFYVWVDAPMGYVSGFKELCQKKTDLDFDSYWKSSEKTEVYHFIGKDIAYFHTLFWPAQLKAADYRTPTGVFAHGHLTVNGLKMSKSKGTKIDARTYLNHLDATYLRYYYACKLNSGSDDLDLNLEDFVSRVNSDLVGKITNLGSRGAQMLGKRFSGEITPFDLDGQELYKQVAAKSEEIAALYEAREFAKAIAEIRSLADEANRYFDGKAPWKLVETDPQRTQQVLSATLSVFRALAIYLKPVLPVFTAKVEALFGEVPWNWVDIATPRTNGRIGEYQHLITRIDPEKIKAMVEESKQLDAQNAPDVKPAGSAAAHSSGGASQDANSKTMDSTKLAAVRDTGLLPEIEIDTFSKVDLRVAQILDAESIPEANKLLRLKISLGPLGERQIIAGIKGAYSAESLKGRLVVVVANLKPRKMKFGMSEGMALAAGQGGNELFLLSPDSGAKAGDPVK